MADLLALTAAACYTVATWADVATTNAALDTGLGRELNAQMLDSGARLGVRFWATHAVVALALMGLVRLGFAEIGELAPYVRERTARDALISFRNDEGRRPWRLLFLAASVLIIQAAVPLSNIVEAMWGVGIPGLVRRGLRALFGGAVAPESAVVAVVIGASLALAFALAPAMIRTTVRWSDRTRDGTSRCDPREGER